MAHCAPRVGRGYPIVESVHVLALCPFLGMALMLDLCLLGVTMRRATVYSAQHVLSDQTGDALSGFNVSVFHRGVYARVAARDLDPVPPGRAKIAAGL